MKPAEPKSNWNKRNVYLLSYVLICMGLFILFQSIGWEKLLQGKTAEVNIGSDSFVRVWTPSSGIQPKFTSRQKLPANLLDEAGIRFYPGDQLTWNGKEIQIDEPLPDRPSYLLQYRPSQQVTVIDAEKELAHSSNAITLGKAVWEAGIHFTRGDQLSLPVDTLITEPLSVEYTQAVPLTVLLAGQEFTTFSASATVGQVLADIGISLQALDYSIPDESQSLPEDGIIEVVRVNEKVNIADQSIEFDEERQADENVDADQEWIIEAGEEGLKTVVERVRFENGEEVARVTELEWVSKEPKTQLVGYGTKPIPLASAPGVDAEAIGQIDGSIDYWAVKTMYATSYYPCGFQSGCSYITASGATLQKGIVAFTSEWYSYLAGTQVYVPGYGVGVVADLGGGIPGTDWIDLGYGNDDYEQWSENVTVYFLNPAPAEIPWFLK